VSTTRNRLAGLGASLLIILLVVGAPLVLMAIGATPWNPELSELGDLLTSPDDGTLALVVIGVVAWIAWAVMTVSFLVEILAALRGVPAPNLPGLGVPQHTANRLVAVAALLFAVAPTATPAFAPQPVHAAPVTEAPRPLVLPEVASVAPTEPPAAPVVMDDREPVTVEYTVRRGDSLWRIAQEHLGDGTRYVEIVALNKDVLHGRPDFIDPGLVLQLPADAASASETIEVAPPPAQTYVVEPGDTLWDIAHEELGEPTRYPEIFEASRDTTQPDGDRLHDPDLIRPGWRLNVPVDEVDTPPVAETPGGKHRSQTPNETAPPTGLPHSPAPTVQPSEAPITGVDDADADEGEEGSVGWLVPGLVGAGALLAGSLLIAVQAHRRTQQRHRLPGHTIAPPPVELRAVEKTATVTGGPTADAIEKVDRLLRHLALVVSPPPRLAAVEVEKRSVTLHLAESATLEEPWHGSDTTWVANLDAPVGDENQLPPYPLLVSVGQDDEGHLWLLELECLGVISVTGDSEHALALARHIVAELALNPWSAITEIDTIDLAPELVPLDPGRLRHHAADDTEFVDRLGRDLAAIQQAGLGEPEPFRALLLTGAARGDNVRSVVDLVRGQQCRAGLVVVSVGAAESGDSMLELTADGRLRVPHLGLDLMAAGLTAEEAAACAAIVDVARDAPVVPMPLEEQPMGWRALADHAGALVDDLTESRPATEAGAKSLLPESAQRYESVSTATADDVAILAPLVPEEARRKVEESDPLLDEDLAEWSNPASPLPKLALLGPVTATVRGAVARVAERKAFFTELLAFLALHPSGVSSRQVQDAFGLKASRARTDLALLRQWLGINPRTGEQHLPPATASPAHEARGTGGYQLTDVLVDLDLFRRLRARGQARGADGMPDLVAALELLGGQPFSNLRDRGWSWLLDDERIHETSTFAVVDVAHIVVTDALSRGDLVHARFAAETACRAAPYDEVCRLDLAKIAEAEGHGDEAEEILDKHVFNRTDDHLPPIDLVRRTAEVVKNNNWGHKERPGSP
jgi:nucleoid-associated protein YgaU